MIDKSETKIIGIDDDLSIINAAVAELCELASDPASSKDGWKVYDFSIRWGVWMSGRLKRLEHYYRAGKLSESQKQSYRKLRRQLAESLPLIERLDITRPGVPLED